MGWILKKAICPYCGQKVAITPRRQMMSVHRIAPGAPEECFGSHTSMHLPLIRGELISLSAQSDT